MKQNKVCPYGARDDGVVSIRGGTIVFATSSTLNNLTLILMDVCKFVVILFNK